MHASCKVDFINLYHSKKNKIVNLHNNGLNYRDFTYVDDIVDGIEAALSSPNGYRIMNLGGTRTIQLSDLVHLISERLNCSAQIEYLPDQAGDVSITSADVSVAQAAIGYSPSTSIEEGLTKFIDWFKHMRNL